MYSYEGNKIKLVKIKYKGIGENKGYVRITP